MSVRVGAFVCVCGGVRVFVCVYWFVCGRMWVRVWVGACVWVRACVCGCGACVRVRQGV